MNFGYLVWVRFKTKKKKIDNFVLSFKTGLLRETKSFGLNSGN